MPRNGLDSAVIVRITPEQDAALQILRGRTRPISAADLGEALFVSGITSAKGRAVVRSWLDGLAEAGLACSIAVEPSGGRLRRMWSVVTGVQRLKFCVYRRRSIQRSFVIDQD